MAKHIELGKKGEAVALKFLQDKGYQLIQQNYRSGRGEIDIVMRSDDNRLVFVEVKARVNFVSPEESVHFTKGKLLTDTAIAYKEEKNIEEETFFDIIAINFQKGAAPEIRHFEDLWY
jgi:putative endonuclease